MFGGSITGSRSGLVSGLVALVLLGVGLAPRSAGAATITFGFDNHSWVVPPGVFDATFDVYGAQGGGVAPTFGGLGAHVRATIPVVPGEVLQTNGGGAGGTPGGGFNGGATGASGGGGASDVRRGPAYALAGRLIVAGGGGGDGGGGFVFTMGPGDGNYPFGEGGASGTAGAAPTNAPAGEAPGAGGGPGTQTAGGSNAGALGIGGVSFYNDPNAQAGAGGGGGGGYYGGGGGFGGRSTIINTGSGGTQIFASGGGGGGGGSSLVPAGGTVENGVKTGNGSVTITWEPSPRVTTTTADPVGVDSATLGGSINPSGNASTYHFEWGPTASYGTTTAEKDAGSGTVELALSELIAGLAPDTEYHYRIVGTTCGGCPMGTKSTPDRTFTTGDGAPQIDGPAKGKARITKRGAFTVPGVTISCVPGGPECEAEAVVRSGAGGGAKRAAQLGSTSFVVAAGGTSPVALSVNHRTAKQVRKRHKLRVRIQVDVTAGAKSSSKTVALKLKPPKKKRH